MTFKQVFVDDFPDLPERKQIYLGFSKFNVEMERHGISVKEWVDGSFVEKNKHPADIDVLVIMRYDHPSQLSIEAQQHFYDCVVRRDNDSRLKYHTHCFFMFWYPPNHEQRCEFEYWRSYWSDVFGNSRGIGFTSCVFEECGPPKGIVEVEIGDPLKIPPIHD